MYTSSHESTQVHSSLVYTSIIICVFHLTIFTTHTPAVLDVLDTGRINGQYDWHSMYISGG